MDIFFHFVQRRFKKNITYNFLPNIKRNVVLHEVLKTSILLMLVSSLMVREH